MMASLAVVDSVLVIADIARTVNDFRPLAETLNKICRRISGIQGYDRTAVFMPRPQRDALEILGSWGLSDAYLEHINHDHPLGLDADTEQGLSPAAEAYRSGLPVAITDVEMEPMLDPWRSATRFEHYRSLTCVPVIVRSQVIGVLVCYGRDPHQHAREELDLLQLVSRLAGIAIETARVADGQRRVSGELRTLSERLKDRNVELVRLSSIQTRLIEQLVQPGAMAVEGTARILSEITGSSVLVAGRAGNAIAHVGPAESRSTMIQLAARREVAELLRRDQVVTVAGTTCVRLGLPETPIGTLMLDPALDDPQGTSALATLHGALVVTAELLSEQADRTLGTHARPAVLLALANGLYCETDAREAAGIMGIPVDAPVRLAVIRCASREAAQRVARWLLLFRPGDWPVVTMTQSGRDTLALLTAGPAQLLRSTALRVLEQQPEIQGIGVSAAVQGLGDLAAARRGADLTADLAASLNKGSAMLYEDLGPYGTLVGDLAPGRALELVNKTLGPVLSHDAAHGTQLMATLKAFVEYSGRVQSAAAALHIHPNTMHQRLRRLAQLAHVDIHDYRNLGSLVLALEWDRLVGASKSNGADS